MKLPTDEVISDRAGTLGVHIYQLAKGDADYLRAILGASAALQAEMVAQGSDLDVVIATHRKAVEANLAVFASKGTAGSA